MHQGGKNNVSKCVSVRFYDWENECGRSVDTFSAHEQRMQKATEPRMKTNKTEN